MIKDFLIETVIPYVLSLLKENPNTAPIIVALVLIQGFCRLWLKPAMTALVAFTDWTETQKDNEFLQKIFATKAYKVFSFIVDWMLSIKLPQSKKEKENENTNNDTSKLADRINKL